MKKNNNDWSNFHRESAIFKSNSLPKFPVAKSNQLQKDGDSKTKHFPVRNFQNTNIWVGALSTQTQSKFGAISEQLQSDQPTAEINGMHVREYRFPTEPRELADSKVTKNHYRNSHNTIGKTAENSFSSEKSQQEKVMHEGSNVKQLFWGKRRSMGDITTGPGKLIIYMQ